MDNVDNKENTPMNEILSHSVRMGRRTYFFDLKVSKSEEPYLTITESKRQLDQNTGNFYYEKRKVKRAMPPQGVFLRYVLLSVRFSVHRMRRKNF